MKTIEEITARMTAIADGEITDELAAEFDQLEQDLKVAQRSAGIKERNAAYNTTVIPAGTPRSGVKPEEEMDGFRNYLRTGKANADLRPQNAQSEGVPTEGGYLAPDEFRRKLVERLKAFGGIASIAERYSTGSGAPVEWPTIDDTNNLGEIVQEGNTFSAGADLVFGTNSLGAYSYATGGSGSTPIRISWELIQDAAFDIVGLATRLMAVRIGRIQAIHWARGSGVAQPLGLLTGKTPIQNAVNTGITYNSLVTAIHSVDPAYRENARWAFNDLTMAEIEKITDSHGDPVFRGWGADLGQGFTETRLLGFPVTIDQAIPTVVANSPTTVWGAFGDIRQGYVIRDVKDVAVVANPWTRANFRQTELTAWARADGTQQDPNAYVTLSGKS